MYKWMKLQSLRYLVFIISTKFDSGNRSLKVAFGIVLAANDKHSSTLFI